MIIIAQRTDGNLAQLVQEIERLGYVADVSEGEETIVIGVKGNTRSLSEDAFRGLPGVQEVRRISTPYKEVSRTFHPNHQVEVDGHQVGNRKPVIIAGPCAIENRGQALATFAEIADYTTFFRGFLYKPRTSPYEFQGLRQEGIPILQEAKEIYQKPVVQEVLDPRHLEILDEITDIYQIGTRNMYNYELLKAVGETGKPVILKRGWTATLDEWLLAAEYIALTGNLNILLCERGIRTPMAGDYGRNTPDLNVIPAVLDRSCLPVIFDPSHSTGRAELVVPTSLAAIAMGAQGLEIDVMPQGYDRRKLKVDGLQAITVTELKEIVEKIGRT